VNIMEFYQRVPQERHREIVVFDQRLFFGGEEYIIEDDGELRLVHSHKGIEERLSRIEKKLGIT